MQPHWLVADGSHWHTHTLVCMLQGHGACPLCGRTLAWTLFISSCFIYLYSTHLSTQFPKVHCTMQWLMGSSEVLWSWMRLAWILALLLTMPSQVHYLALEPVSSSIKWSLQSLFLGLLWGLDSSPDLWQDPIRTAHLLYPCSPFPTEHRLCQSCHWHCRGRRGTVNLRLVLRVG